MRFDAGFWSNDTIAVLNRHDVRYTMAVRCGNKAIAAAIAGIDETAWRTIDYTPAARRRSPSAPTPPAPASTSGDAPVDRASHPPHRDRAATAVARLASPRVLDRPHRRRRRGGPVPPPPRRGRARHPRPQRRRRARTRPVGELPRQLGMAASRGARPQPDPLDRHLGRSASATNSPLLAPCAPDSSRSLAGSSTGPDAPSCGSRPDGHGPPRSRPRSTRSGCCDPRPPDDHHRGQARRSTHPRADNPNSTNPASTRPDTHQRPAPDPRSAHRPEVPTLWTHPPTGWGSSRS
jgi:hypothetical protein